MSSLSVDGLVSGLDTSSLISQLMQLEKQPQVRLQSRRSDLVKVTDIYRSMNTRFGAVESAAEKLSGADAWKLTKATSSDPTVAAITGTTTGGVATLRFEVTSLAKSHSVIGSTAVADPAAAGLASGDITIGTTTIPAADLGTGSMNDIAKAVNSSAAGVTASVVQVSPGQYKLQLSARTTGAASEFAVGGLGSLGTFGVVSQGTDATIKVGDGPGAYTVTSATGSFADVIPGATITAKALGLATVSVEEDNGTLADRAEALIKSVNDATALIRQNSNYDPVTKKAGALLSDNGADRLRRDLLDAVTGTVIDGRTASSVGITMDKSGVLSINREKFLAAVEADPAAVAKLFGANGAATTDDGIAERLRVVTDKATKYGTGQITTAITQREDNLKSLDTQIASFETRFELREAALKRQFSALETALSSLQNQGSWLSGAISSLPRWG